MAASLGKRTRSEPSAETPLHPGNSGLDNSSHDGSEFLQAPGNTAFCGQTEGARNPVEEAGAFLHVYTADSAHGDHTETKWSLDELKQAIMRGDTESATRLVETNSDFVRTTIGLDGSSPLHLAAKMNRLEVAKVLLAVGADQKVVTRRNDDGHSALHFAVAPCHLEMAKLLIKGGADPNAVNCGGHTVLHLALAGLDELTETRSDMVKFLLDAGADPRAKDKTGRTLLHLAVENAAAFGSFSFRVKNEEIVGDVLRQLVAAGADCSIKDSQGRTVYDRLRKRRKLFEMVEAADEAAKKMAVKKMGAFTMGFHDRLGANSSLSFLKELDPDVLRDHVFSKL
jgi:hypothetical protein